MIKALSEITRSEWIAIRWIEVTEMGDPERMFIEVQKRTPDEAAKAKNDWDLTEEDRENVAKRSKSTGKSLK